MEHEQLTTVDLKALYDFACFHAELKIHTGTKEEAKKAEKDRDTLYTELNRRLDIHAVILRTKHLY